VTAKVDCRDKAGKEVEPRSLCTVAMLAIEVIDHGFDGSLVRYGVAKDTVVESLLKCLEDFRCSEEVHVGDPER
jgi:hypothetical protein